jgi:hypothetical protein
MFTLLSFVQQLGFVSILLFPIYLSFFPSASIIILSAKEPPSFHFPLQIRLECCALIYFTLCIHRVNTITNVLVYSYVLF